MHAEDSQFQELIQSRSVLPDKLMNIEVQGNVMEQSGIGYFTNTASSPLNIEMFHFFEKVERTFVFSNLSLEKTNIF